MLLLDGSAYIGDDEYSFLDYASLEVSYFKTNGTTFSTSSEVQTLLKVT